MASNHTPGPWIDKHWDANQQITITALAFRGPNVLALVRPPLTLIEPTPVRAITEWSCTEKDVTEAAANARLIAAAPDMLQALRIAEEELQFDKERATYGTEPRVVDQALRLVRQAIAKAEGG